MILTIKNTLKMSVLSVSLFALTGCGGDAACCDGVGQVASSSANIGEKGVVASLKPLSSALNPTALITINGEDVALAKLTPCVNNTFSALGSNDPDGNNDNLTYKWKGLDNQDLGTASTFNKTFCNKGLYEVALEVTDEQNLTGKDSVCFLVGLDKMPLVVEVGESQTVREGESITLSASVLCQDDSAFDYKWTECGKEISTDASFSTSDLSVGEHTFKVVVTDADGRCVARYIKVTVTS